MKYLKPISFSAFTLGFALFACGSGGLATAPSDGSATPKGAQSKAKVIGWSGDVLYVGNVLKENGDSLDVDWGTAKGTVKRDAVAPVVAASELKAGLRVVTPNSAASAMAAIGTVVAVSGPERIRIKWDLDDKEEEIPSGLAALLTRDLCKREKGCKYGVGKTPGSSAESAAPIAGVKVGSWLGVQYKVRGASYWSPGQVIEVQDGGFKVNVAGQGHIAAAMADIRPALKAEDLKPGMKVQCGVAPMGLTEGYFVRVEGGEALVSSDPDGSSPRKFKLGEGVFGAP